MQIRLRQKSQKKWKNPTFNRALANLRLSMLQVADVFYRKFEMETIVRKPITAELKSLKVGASTTYPIEQRSSVIAVINRLRKELIRDRWDAELCDDTDNYSVIVTRKRREESECDD